jgi:CheY-like chemotaxis protein
MLRILVVEDNAADARMLETALEKTGFPLTITILEDGAKAIEYLNRNPGQNDVLLLDLNLPRLSGFEVLRIIRSREDLRSLPVVIMSGSTNTEEIHRCYQAGANSYMCKPIHLDEVYSAAVRFVAYWSNCVQLPSRNPGSTAGDRSAEVAVATARLFSA